VNSSLLTMPRDRTNPIGYKVSRITFASGEPVAPANSTNALTDIFANADDSVCPTNCFRPVGIAFDGKGRMFISSDATGEIYVVVSDQTATSTSTGSSPTASSAAGKLGVGLAAYLALLMSLVISSYT
jgi:hypothetical protein